MKKQLTVECNFPVRRHGRGCRKEVAPGQKRQPPAIESGRVPRIARLMALAIRFEHLVRSGQIAGYTELAELGHVSRSRIRQIMNLTLLAPDIQEQLLFLPRTERRRDAIHLRQLESIALLSDWRHQRRWWRDLYRQLG